MLTERQQEIFNHIKKAFDEKGRPPRLMELTEKFQITNKAILDHLDAIEKEGFISMPEGVLSLKIVKRHENDIFISYSSEDREIAGKIYDYFLNEGFRVWKDNLLRSGDSFISEVFENIKKSKTVIVLLSNNSLNSEFVKKEIECALGYQIERGSPLIIPLKIDDLLDKQKIFSSIKSIHYEKYDKNQPEKSLMILADRIHILAYEHQESEVKKSKETVNLNLNKFLALAKKDIDDELKKNPPPNGFFPFKEVIINPIEKKEYLQNELEDLIKKGIVKINGWGGDRFPPYYHDYGHDAVYVTKGLKCYDAMKWPECNWGFSYWRIDSNLNFICRNVLREAYRERLKNKSSIEWFILDVVRPLMFVQNLRELTGQDRWKLKFTFSGLKGRELVILSTSRSGFLQPYICSEDAIEKEFLVNANTDLKELAFQFCYEICLLFQWRNPNEEMLRKDIDAILGGKFV
ncbi:MAG: TIR domain-containing protein [Candidatus Peregrinibacteria bacterium]|nr:TIR domain-containing protein [Candidatus Peregrinibacteria bacterium]